MNIRTCHELPYGFARCRLGGILVDRKNFAEVAGWSHPFTRRPGKAPSGAPYL
jgi:hypothetical protein